MRRPRKAVNQINVVPYIDVMLVLLVIFMITAPLINQGEIQVPSVSRANPAPASPPLIVQIKRDGLSLSDQANGGHAVPGTRDEIIARVIALHAQAPEQPVVIAADGKTQYGDVISLLDQFQKSGVSKVGLLTQQKN